MRREREHPRELLAEYVEGSLDPERTARVESHLSSCDVCRDEVALAGSAREALAALPEVEPPAIRPSWRCQGDSGVPK